MQNLYSSLKTFFGFEHFRQSQENIIKSILDGNDTLAVMPTGGGKSLCYQLPSILMHGTAIIFSPLIALMHDQVQVLRQRNINAALINSSITYEEAENVINSAKNEQIKLLYIAPERLKSRTFLNALAHINVSFIGIDEAHCISEWGHDFRPAYLDITDIFKYIPRKPIIALTATATKEVQEDILLRLDMQNPKKFVSGFDRSNLFYNVINTYDKETPLIEECQSLVDGSMIIYCGSRKRAMKTYETLNNSKIKCELYHGGMNQIVRKSVQNRFISGKTKIIIATNAFGMGIDKFDVRKVIHLDIPATLEAYYQEAGRAGRDGKPSFCTLLFSETDRDLQDFFIEQTYPSKIFILTVYNEIYVRIYNNNSNDVLDFNEIDFANDIKLPVYIVKSVIQIFEKFQIIDLISADKNSQIKLTTTRERFIEFFNNQNGDKKYATEVILRSLSGEAFNKFVPFDLKGIQLKHNIKENILLDTLKQLKFFEIIDFVAPGLSKRLQLNVFDIETCIEKIEFDKMEKRCEFAKNKLDIMLEYARTKKCKRSFILNYFGEDTNYANCNNCSSCR